MANVKVSELPAASAASTTQEFEVNNGGTSQKVTGNQIKSMVKTGLVLADVTDVTATATELNTLDGITASTAELNILDGVTTSTVELNYVDGVTSAIQTQLNGKEASLGFTPIQQGGGAGQLANKIYIGWSGSGLKLQVDASDLGGIALKSDLTNASLVYLGLVNTTSGTSQTLSGLNLSNYQFLHLIFRGVSHNSGTARNIRIGPNSSIVGQTAGSAADVARGIATVWLGDGTYASDMAAGAAAALNSGVAAVSYAGTCGITQSSTGVTVSLSGDSFDAGSVFFYGEP